MSGFALRAQPASVRSEDPVISVFEFWPGWLFYLPVVAQWIWLGLRYGDFSLPTAANPTIETGGLCGESKTAILDLVQPGMRDSFAPYTSVLIGPDAQREAETALADHPLGWPLVIKPDIGCNGAGVRIVHDPARLATALAAFPRGIRVMLQAFVDAPGEAGLFYIRRPGEARGRITSLTLKSSPVVVGDGRTCLRDLIAAHPRAGRVPQLYLPRLAARWAEIPATGAVVPLVFTGNHCKGSVFHDGAGEITPALTEWAERVARGIPGFHFGRIDLRYPTDAALRRAEGLTILEVNGVGSEATHIWDPRCSLRHAYASQFSHYRAAFEIGRTMRAAGHPPCGLREMKRQWLRQRRLMASYPMND